MTSIIFVRNHKDNVLILCCALQQHKLYDIHCSSRKGSQMASKGTVCGGCRQLIGNSNCLKCMKCNKFYDLDCANILDRKIFTSMSKEMKSKWKCCECISKLPKAGNSNTPVRNINPSVKESEASSQVSDDETISRENITMRKQPSASQQLSPQRPVYSPSSHNKDEDFISAISEQVLKAIKAELPGMITSILKSELSSIKTDMSDFRLSVDTMSTMHDEMKKMVETLVKDNASLSKKYTVINNTVTQLSERLNNLEQHLRENNLEIQGVPEFHSENLPILLQQCSKVVGHILQQDDVIKCTRVAKQNKESKLPRAIIVKFKNVRTRDEFYSAVYRYNKSNPNEKLNTSLLGIAGDRKPVFVSEHLSPANKSLHAAARKKAKELGYKFVWVKNGHIYVRKTVESKFILIKNNSSLDLIC